MPGAGRSRLVAKKGALTGIATSGNKGMCRHKGARAAQGVTVLAGGAASMYVFSQHVGAYSGARWHAACKAARKGRQGERPPARRCRSVSAQKGEVASAGKRKPKIMPACVARGRSAGVAVHVRAGCSFAAR